MEDAFCRFGALEDAFSDSVVYCISVAKNALKAVVSVSDSAALLFYSFARFFLFFVISAFYFFAFFLSFLTDSLTH